MISGMMFVGVAVVVLIVWMLISLRKVENKSEYFKTDTGKGILRGILTAIGVSILIVIAFVIFGCSPAQAKYGTFNNGATVFAGLDYTKKVSPMCEEDGEDHHSTSNLGMKYHLFESLDDKFRTNVKYTHHSCAFSEDDKGYDGIGLELEYKLW